VGDRGPAPRREAEVRRRNNKGTATQLGPEELQQLPFEIDYNPEPPELTEAAEDEEWHPAAKEFWRALKTDPARAWMTSADWAAAQIVCESISRDLRPQVVGVTETGDVVKDRVPMKGANLSSYLKFMAMIGITESARLRISKEITLFKSEPTQLASVSDIDSARDEEVQ